MKRFRKGTTSLLATSGVVTLGVIATLSGAAGLSANAAPPVAAASTATPIKHLVVIFDENVSFDHYFGTYPYATNPAGEPAFHADASTPSVNGLVNQVGPNGATGPLLTSNPNLSNPMRLDPSDTMTCDQDHDYTAEQQAADHGAEDLYVQKTGASLTLAQCLANENASLTTPAPIPAGATNNYAVMDYYDGNTVTGLWNYAQNFAMSDNAYGTTYGPSTPGALNVTAGQTYGAICGPTSATINDSPCPAPPGLNTANVTASAITASAGGTTSVANQPAAGPGTVYSDADPTYDICSYMPKANGGDNKAPAATIAMGGNNVGEELTTSGVSWGWFQGGFDDGYVPGHGTAPTTAQVCSESHTDAGGESVVDYNPHHEPFEYYASTANPMHLPPTSVSMVGHNDQANHQYDTADFFAAANSGNLPAVSYLKAPDYQDGHAGYSDPIDEQAWVVSTINKLEALPSWASTAVVVTYDDSDGWYDHQLAPVTSSSETSLDALTGPDACGPASNVPTSTAGTSEQGRCGLGPRLPFLVISPYAKHNSVSDNLIDQSSVVKFIESNWHLPAQGNGATDVNAGSLDSMFSWRFPTNPPLFLNPSTGEPIRGAFGNGQRQNQQ